MTGTRMKMQNDSFSEDQNGKHGFEVASRGGESQ
jgi:hypothetical protein